MYEYVCMNIDVMNMYEYVRMNIDVRVAAYQQSWSGTNFYIYFCWLWLLLFLVFTTAEELALHD